MADTFAMKDSLGAVWVVVKALLGLGLVLAGLGFLCFSEAAGRKTLLGREEFVVSARAISADKLDPANDGQPVIVTGKLDTHQNIEDPMFGVAFSDVVSAYREVSMRQHDEVWTGSGDNERMTGHKQVWSSEPISCRSKPNPPFPVRSKFLVGSDYRVGVFSIPKDMAAHVEGSSARLPTLRPDAKMAALGDWELDKKFYTVKRSKRKDGVGNVRLRYLVLKPCEVTVLGQQQGDRIEPFIDMSGGETYAIIKGKASAASLKKSATRPPSMAGSRAIAAPLLWFGFLALISLKVSVVARPGFAAFLATLAVPLSMMIASFFVWRVQPHLNL